MRNSKLTTKSTTKPITKPINKSRRKTKVEGLPDSDPLGKANVPCKKGDIDCLEKLIIGKKISKEELISLLRYNKGMDEELNINILAFFGVDFFPYRTPIQSLNDVVESLPKGIGYSITTMPEGKTRNASVFTVGEGIKKKTLCPFDCIGYTPQSALLQAMIHGWDDIKKLLIVS